MNKITSAFKGLMFLSLVYVHLRYGKVNYTFYGIQLPFLAEMDTSWRTQNLSFSVPFHLYIHDHDSKWAGCTPTWGSDMYVPLIHFPTYYGIQLGSLIFLCNQPIYQVSGHVESFLNEWLKFDSSPINPLLTKDAYTCLQYIPCCNSYYYHATLGFPHCSDYIHDRTDFHFV